MSQEDAPKLYTNKPKKAQIKQHPNSKPNSTTASSYQMGSQSQAPPPPPPPPKESFARRYKFFWPLLLTVNLGVGAYLFMRTKKKDTNTEEEPAKDVSPNASSTVPVTPAGVTEQSLITSSKPREPIPENQQRELFKWILEEKRKMKPKDPEEKKRIDQEKAILKDFIRAKSIPTI